VTLVEVTVGLDTIRSASERWQYDGAHGSVGDELAIGVDAHRVRAFDAKVNRRWIRRRQLEAKWLPTAARSGCGSASRPSQRTAA